MPREGRPPPWYHSDGDPGTDDEQRPNPSTSRGRSRRRAGRTQAVLSGARDIEVVGEAKTGREAVSLAERFKPDVVVMDLTMPDVDGTSATKEIVQKGLPTKVLVLTMHAEDDYLVPLMEAGAAGYLMKNVADRELIDAIRAVARGDVYVGASAARARA